jgi:hypothetical protein
MHERVEAETDLVKEKHPGLAHGDKHNWMRLDGYRLPAGRYNKTTTTILFNIPSCYPQAGPDDFFVDGDLRLADGSPPPGFNAGSQSSSGPAPIEGNWGWFSWHPGSWRPAADIDRGDNLLTFLRSVDQCLLGRETT